MRWIPFAILAYVVILVQVTLGTVLVVMTPLGFVGVDLAAITAVFVAMRARNGADAMIACWILGMAVDLATGGFVVGPMAIAFAAAGGGLFRVREAFFRERALTQATLTLFFVLLSHGLWLTMQMLRLGGWGRWGEMLLQSVGIAAFSAVLAPLATFMLKKCERWVFVTLSRRSR